MTVDSPYTELLADTPVATGRVSILGGETHYWSYGPEDAELTIVAIHGFRGEHHGLEPVVAHLRGIRVISPDLPAFGESAPLPSTPHSIDGYALWLREFVAALELDSPPVILGHSFGSIVVAAAVAGGLDAPRLILINPIAAPALHGPKAFLTWLTVAYYHTAKMLPERAGRAFLGNRVIVRFMSLIMVTSREPALRRWVHDQHDTYFSRFATTTSLVEGFHASISSDVSSFAPDIRIPTLLLGADHDPITKVQALHDLADSLGGARLEVLEGVGHLIHYERPREAATAIVSFLGVGSVARPPS